jgi:hypothetical protein
MRIRAEISLLPMLCILLAPSAAGKVLVRWTRSTMPPVKTLGVKDVVVSWNATSAPLFKTARELGYRVYAEASLTQASAAAEAAAKDGLAGVVIDVENSEKPKADDVLRSLLTAYPELTVLILSSRGIEPQMRGRRMRNKDGVLQVTSPTSQPWIDSNLAAVRIERALFPAQVPLYSFQWDPSEPLRRQHGPSAEDFLLAVAEAGAFHADLVLNLAENLQRALALHNAGGLAIWKKVKRYIEFWPQEKQDSMEPLTNVGIVMDDNEKSYEAVNLMARHNIQIRAMRSDELKTHSLDLLDIAVVFATLEKDQSGIIADFAAQGGIAILVDSHGSHPWQSAQPLRSTEHSVTYEVGRGRIIELSEPVTDPETFARDVRRLMDKQKVLISLWNSLTTVAALYDDPSGRETILELVNYSEEPVGIQIQVKGSFPSVRYETPESGCCESLTPELRNGFTEFEVPPLVIGGRVHLALQ